MKVADIFIITLFIYDGYTNESTNVIILFSSFFLTHILKLVHVIFAMSAKHLVVQMWSLGPLFCITSYCITSHYIASHRIISHRITLHYIASRDGNSFLFHFPCFPSPFLSFRLIPSLDPLLLSSPNTIHPPHPIPSPAPSPVFFTRTQQEPWACDRPCKECEGGRGAEGLQHGRDVQSVRPTWMSLIRNGRWHQGTYCTRVLTLCREYYGQSSSVIVIVE